MNTSDASSFILFAIFIVVGIVLWRIASNSKNAPPITYIARPSIPEDDIEEFIIKSMPKNPVTSLYNWKGSYPTDDIFLLKGYYLSEWQNFWVLILTGIFPGALLIGLCMGRSEQINVDFSKLQSTGELIVEARGLRAQQEAKKLVDKLNLKSA